MTRSFSDMVAEEARKSVQPTPEPAPWVPIPDSQTLPKELEGHEGTYVQPVTKSTAKVAPAPSADFEALTAGLPPDTHGAAGPNHLIVVVNFRVLIQDKSGNTISNVTLGTFFSGLGATDIFDPKVIYDPHSGRFMFVACAQRRSAASGMLLAVSASSDPTGEWHLWNFDGDSANANWVDFPNLGVTATRLTFTSNMFTISGDTFRGANVWSIDKATALDGGAIKSTLFFVTGVGSTLVPALTFDTNIATHYLINPYYSPGGYLRLHTITGTAASPAFTTTTLWPTGDPWGDGLPDADQLGTTTKLQTNDARLMNAVVRNGSLWVCHTAGLPRLSSTHCAVQWWEIDVANGSPALGSVVQTGFIDHFTSGGLTPGMHYYFPSIAVNKDDDVLVGFTGSSSTLYAGAFYAFRSAATPLGQMDGVVRYEAGAGTYGGSRWGDYSAACVDPADDTTLWTIQEYAKGGGQYGTRWAKVAPGGGGGTDTTKPRVSSAAAQSSTTVSVVFSEAMTNNAALTSTVNYVFGGGGVVLNASSVTRISDTQVRVTVNEMTQGASYTVSVLTTGPTDLAGNPLDSTGNSASFTGQGNPPTAAITRDGASPTNADSVAFSVDFNKPVAPSFTSADVTATGTLATGAAVSVVGPDPTYTVTVTPSNPNANGTIGITVGTSVFDLLGNAYAGGSSTSSYTFDNTPPVVTVNATITNDPTPPLTGTVDDTAATLSVSVGGQTRPATNNGNGTWTLANNSLTTLADGTYNVSVTATDAVGNAGTDSTTGELTVDTTAPAVSVSTLSTNDTTPPLGGTVNDPTASISVSVGGQVRIATNNGNGTWTLANNSLTALADGTYNVTATATDAFGNSGTDGTTNELRIDATAPLVTVNTLFTQDNRPPLSGTVNDPAATVSISVGGQTRAATNNGNGTWTLADNAISPALADGTYNVAATATDSFGNARTDSGSNELTIDTTPPAVTVTTLSTNDNRPPLTGTINDATATVSITVGGQTRSATNNGNGTWTLADDLINPGLAGGTYNVVATGTDSAGNSANDATTNELTIDTTPPTITVTPLSTNDNRPPLTGTINDPTATISVTAGGQIRSATNNGNGTWALVDNSLNALADGTYNVAATATDTFGNAATDGTTNELIIDTVAPTVTVNSKTTNDTTPSLSGTVNDAASSISVVVSGQTRAATNNGNGTWTLADNLLAALAQGTFNVAATATDSVGNTRTDSSTNELTIDTVAPTVTVNAKTTNDTTPSLSGTVNDTTAAISITVGGQTRAATNNGNGTWTLADNVLTALANGTFNVAATATDTAGNSGNDGTTNELTIDTVVPAITVNSRTTNDNTPQLTGTVNDTTATISISVGGQTRAATNNGNGTWTLADGAISPGLADGTYNVAATATDPAGNAGNDASTNELTIDTTAPAITVNSLATNDSTPQLTGTVNDTAATVSISVGGQTRTATNNGNGTWTLANNSLTALASGTYNVAATATDAIGNVGADVTTNELTIDTTAPTVTVNTLATYDSTPQLTGTVNDTTAAISITVGGQTRTATNNGNGTWTLANNSLTVLANGTYNVAATATDTFGNASTDATTNELTIDTTAPTVTVANRLTNDTTPSLSGTVNDATASISITVGGQTRSATNNGNGTWTLVDGAVNPALAPGTYNVAASATDPVGNVGNDATLNELVIDVTAPAITVNVLETNDNTPPLGGTVDDTAASISVTVGGQTRTATNNGNGTWTLANGALTALADGTYDVAATASDGAGNSRTDSTTGELRVDTVAPTVTVNTLATRDNRPPLGGTVNDNSAAITLSVGGQNRSATNNGNGTWSLADNSLTVLANGVYNVAVTATDSVGNAGTDATTNELTIDTVAPTAVITLAGASPTSANSLGFSVVFSKNVAPTFTAADITRTGTLSGGANIAVTGTDPNYTATVTPAEPNADGTLGISIGTAVADALGNSYAGGSSGQYTVDNTPPTVTVNALTTNDTTPQLTGTVNDATATLSVTVGGQTLPATNNGNGTWTLPNGALSPLADGTYNVTATATDSLGNAASDATSNELTIDNTAPTVTVTPRTTNDTTPQITGTVNDPAATVVIAVAGQNVGATNNGDGSWTVADNVLTNIAAGTHNVAATATDSLGNIGTDATSNELTISTDAPTVTVTAVGTTNDNTPPLSGTVASANTITGVNVNVGGSNYAANVPGDGTWNIADNTITPLADGSYDITATASDNLGNVGTDSTQNELTVDTVAPAVTVDSRLTNDTTPSLSGTVNDPAAVIALSVDGQNVAPTNNGDGTWTLADNVLTALANGTFNVAVTATDVAGNAGNDATTNELTIDTSAPTVTVTGLLTNDTTPPLGGTVNDPNATISLLVSGQNVTATNNGDGTWTLADNSLAALAPGTYNVAATATDAAGNAGTDGTTSELTVDTAVPAITVNPLLTNDTTPALTGTVNDSTAAIAVSVGGQNVAATNNLNGTWTLADNVLTPLGNGTFNVTASATDGAGNVGTDGTNNELTIDTVVPLVTADAKVTNDTTPALSGTVNDGTATVSVTVSGQTNPATNNGDGTWILPDNTLTALVDGIYDINVTATDPAGNASPATEVGGLEIDTSDPSVTVDSGTMSDPTPEIKGNVNDSRSTIVVRIDGVKYTAINNGDGTWTLVDDTVQPLSDGTYDIQVEAIDPAGNTTVTTGSLTIDTTAPTAIIALPGPTPTNANALTFTVSFSESVDPTFTSADVTPTGTVAGGATVTSVVGGPADYTVTVTPTNPNGEGTLGISIGTTVTDSDGNAFGGASSAFYTLDNTAPTTTVNPLTTNDSTPSLSGTVNDNSATISVTVGGQTRTATNNGNGAWTLPDGLINPALGTPGTTTTFNVTVQATDTAGNVGNTVANNALTVDLQAPTITVNALATTDATPPLTGTINDNAAAISVNVGGQARTATNNGNGTWTLADNTLSSLADGTYNVTATATDAVGNIGSDATVDELRIDRTAPVVAVTPLSTQDSTPPLGGTVDDTTATIAITVSGQNVAGVNNGDGTWSLADNVLAPLPNGTFNVAVTATDALGNAGTDATIGELTVDTTAPGAAITLGAATPTNADILRFVVTFTESVSPTFTQADVSLAGTLAGGVAIVVSGTGANYTVTITPTNPNADGTVGITLGTAIADAVGNAYAGGSSPLYTVDNTPPTVTVNTLSTTDNTPPLGGSINDNAATISIAISGQTLPATNNGDGTWSLADNALAALADGDYDVVATATDAVGNNATDATTGELTIDANPPVVTVDILATNDTTPALSGTVDDSAATITLAVGGQNLPATNNGDGTWSLADNLLAALADGIYDVVVTATDVSSNVGVDSTVDELTVDTVAPTVTIASLTSRDATPPLGGTVDDLSAVIAVTVDAQVFLAVNNGDGTWTLTDDTIPSLSEGTHDISVTATDAAGNTGTDSKPGGLVLDLTAPGNLDVNPLLTNDSTPPLGGTIDDPSATLDVTVGGQSLPAVNNGNGTWTIADNTLAPLPDGTYDVALNALDALGNAGAALFNDVLTVDLSAPAVSVAAVTTNDPTPPLAGSVNDPAATLSVTVNGQTAPATNNGDGTWTLANDVLAALADGTYDVAVTATDTLGNAASDATTSELTINTVPPVVTVNTQTTNDVTPTVTGSVTDSNGVATVTVTVNGTDYSATIVGNAWSANVTNALAEGVYDVTANAVDTLGNIGADATTNELTVDTTPPTVVLGAPVPTSTNAGPVVYTLTYTGATTISLDAADVQVVNVSGDAAGTVGAIGEPTATTRTITVDNIIGTGSLTVSVVSGTAVDAAGNNAPAVAPGTPVAVDNTTPVLSSARVVSGLVVEVTFSEPMGAGATTAANYTIVAPGRGSLAANPDAVTAVGGNTVFQLTWNAGEMLGGAAITIEARNAADVLGTPIDGVTSATAAETGIGEGPTATITAPAPFFTQTGPATFVVDYVGASQITLAPADVQIISVQRPDVFVIRKALDHNASIEGTVNGTVTVAGTGTTQRTVTLSNLTGDGILGITIQPNTARDAAGNMASNAIGEATVDVDNTGPTLLSIGIEDARTLTARFNERLAADTTTAANYSLVGPSRGSLAEQPDTVEFVDAENPFYRLHWNAGSLVNGSSVTLNASTQIRDLAGNPMLGTSATSDVTGIDTDPFVTLVDVQGRLAVDITFSEAMGPSALVSANYVVGGSGSGTLSENPDRVELQEGTRYRLSWTGGNMRDGGDLRVDVSTNVLDAGGTPIADPSFGIDVGGAIGDAPTVQSIRRFNPTDEITAAEQVTFRVSFSTAVTGVTTDHFTVAGTTSQATASIAGLAGAGREWDITLNTIEGGGLLRVHLDKNLASITDAIGNPMLLPFTTGEAYNIHRTSPLVLSITRLQPTFVNTNAEKVTFSVLFDENVTGVTAANFSIAATGGQTAATIDTVSGTGRTRSVTVNTALGTGSLTVNVDQQIDTIQSEVGRPLTVPFVDGETYEIDRTPPVISSVAVRDETTVFVMFNKDMGTGVLTAANYTVGGTGAGTLSPNPSSVTSLGNGIYRLNWTSGTMLSDGDVSVAPSSMKDALGNDVLPGSAATHVGGGVGGGGIQVMNLIPVRDATLYEHPTGGLANGSGGVLLVGRNPEGARRRALLFFDVAASLPPRVTITKATLTVTNTDATGPSTPEDISLFAAAADWSEGASNAGDAARMGIAPQSGDATWIHRAFSNALWQTPGGDAQGNALATLNVAGTGFYHWSTDQMTQEVAGWLDNPSSNLGWFLFSAEGIDDAAKAFGSSENSLSAIRPRLRVEFLPITRPELTPIGDQLVDEGQELVVNLRATDIGGDQLAFSANLASLPAGNNASLVDNGDGTGQLRWTPTFTNSGQYEVSVTVTDNDVPPESEQSTFLITVRNVNRAPVFADLPAQAVDEGATLDFVVAATDPDAGDSVALSATNLPSGASFAAATGRVTWTPGFTQSGNYSVRITATDNGSPVMTTRKDIPITVRNVNRAPSLQVPGAQTLAEDQPVAFTLVGTDPDAGDALLFSMADAPAGATLDAATGAFSWRPGFTQAGAHAVAFTVVDNGAPPLADTRTVNFTVTNVNRPPTGLSISSTTLPEESPVGTLVGRLRANDPDEDDAFTFSLVPGEGALHNNFFSIDGDLLRSATVFDFEVASTFSVRVRVQDAAGESAERAITIDIADLNSPPTALDLDNTTVVSGRPAGSIVGTFSTTDADTGDTHTYTLVTGVGDSSNTRFSIVGATLRTAQVLDFNLQPTHGIRVRTTDREGLSFERTFTISVTPVGGEGEGEGEGDPATAESLFDNLEDGDTDFDGQLSLEEAQLLVPSLTEAGFAALDVNQDGLLSAVELEAGFNTSQALIVTPRNADLSRGATTVTFTVSSGFATPVEWRAVIISGDFFTIAEGATGAGLGTIQVAVQENTGDETREGAIRVETVSGVAAPVDLALKQFACVLPPAPTGISASDGTFADRVRVAWNEVAGASSYEILRGSTENVDQLQVVGTSDTPLFDDTTALPPATTAAPTGCNAGGAANVQPVFYFYAVRALSDCGNSPLSAATLGHRGATAKTGKDSVFAEVLPGEVAGPSTRFASPGDPLAIRLRAHEAIDTARLWCLVDTPEYTDESFAWIPVATNPDRDGWVVYESETPFALGTSVVMTVGAFTVSGEAIGPVAYEFILREEDEKEVSETLWQPDTAELGVDVYAEAQPLVVYVDSGHAGLADAPVYAVAPGIAYETPRWVWLPLTAALGDHPVLHYLHETEEGAVWYPAEQVEGWIASEMYIAEVGSVRYLGVALNHGATVTLARPELPAAPDSAGAVGGGRPGDLLVLAAVLALLGTMGTWRRTHSRR